jgi:tetraacyldisaccharide 4'-kinase
VRAPWLDDASASLARRAALAPLVPVSWAWGGLAWLHRHAYASGLLRRARLPCRVVAIGNVVVGGAGKTPAAAWVAANLARRGHRVALASRGHGRRGREPLVVVSDGRRVLANVEAAGDEALLLAAHAPGVPVLVGSRRAWAGWRALSAFGADVLVLDDGFQHHRLARDVDLVLFDGARGLAGGHCLPRGPLREPVGALRRADALGVVDGPLPEADAARLARVAPAAFRFEARRQPVALRALAGGPPQPLALLDGARVGMLCGLAWPTSLRRSLEALGADVVAERCFRDHHRYRPRDLRGLAREAPLWVTTEKDALKLAPHWAADADLRVLAIEFAVEEPARLLDWLEARLRRGQV